MSASIRRKGEERKGNTKYVIVRTEDKKGGSIFNPFYGKKHYIFLGFGGEGDAGL